MKRLALVSVLVFVSALVGCTTAPAPSATGEAAPSRAATAEPTPTPTPTPTPEAADAIVIRVDGFDIVTESGTVLFSHEWPDEAAPAVAELTEIFGSEPTTQDTSTGNTHFPDYREYTWSGFQFDDAINLERPRDQYFRSTGVHVNVAEVNGIAVVAEPGVGVGSTYEQALAASIDHYAHDRSSTFLLAESDTGGGLVLDGDNATQLITVISAPIAMGL
ncbi:UNVERIFIED_CONTAM: hypothetical protein OHV15_00870 [Microbacterium sp. SLM126]